MAEQMNYAILGLGKFGLKVADTISKTGVSILVADADTEKVDSVAGQFDSAVSLNLNNTEALQNIGLENINTVIIDLAGDIEGSIMCTMTAFEAGVDRIIATVDNKRAGEILKRLGADEVIIPEEESALRLAKTLISEDFIEYTDVGDGVCIVKIKVKDSWDNKSIRRLNLHEKNGITIVAVEVDSGLSTDFSADYVLHSGQPIVLAMKRDELYQFV